MADGEKITIQEGDKRSFEVSGLRFVVCRREVGDTGGSTLEVWGEVDGQDTQVLRFDCFRGAPHYHMPPSVPGQLELDAAHHGATGDGLDWAIECVERRLPEMIEKAGYPQLAHSLDAAALAASGAALRRVVKEAPEPTRSFEVDAALVREEAPAP